MRIVRADNKDLPEIVGLCLQLWPENDRAEMEREFQELLQRDDVAVFLTLDEETVGFAQCQLRHDYVEGTRSSPVGYLEGIFVAEPYRNQGYARDLLTACEAWAREKGCSEFASDCELGNDTSLAFHLNVGFEEANRIICFTKKL